LTSDEFVRLRLRLRKSSVALFEHKVKRSGDFPRLIEQILEEVDWDAVAPHDARFWPEIWNEPIVDTAVKLPVELYGRLLKTADDRNTTAARFVEGAMLHYAQKHGLIKPGEDEAAKG
jgi:hypothetical protein